MIKARIRVIWEGINFYGKTTEFEDEEKFNNFKVDWVNKAGDLNSIYLINSNEDLVLFNTDAAKNSVVIIERLETKDDN
jgi:hypothetical protein